MTLTDALTQLRNALPANADNDGPIGVDSAALRVVLDASPKLYNQGGIIPRPEPVTVHVDLSGSADQILDIVKRHIHARGGDVQAALGSADAPESAE